jgi:uncharacterized protein with ATP-grasp and redox domains
MHTDCEHCLYRQVQDLFIRHNIKSAFVRNEINHEIHTFLSKQGNENISAPEASRFANRLIQRHSGIKDLYFEEKKIYNRMK